MVVCPVGGGGLLAGTALTVKARSPSTRVIGAEPAAADDAFHSLASGSLQPSTDPRTMADGLRTSLGQRPFSVIRRCVDSIATATEGEILEAMRFVWERFKIIIEPSCAVPVAPVLNGNLAVEGLRVGIIITGGNVDLEPLFQALAVKWL
jgi:threo-3-hydroxy-L-aspartate ammonia-lyase